MGMGAESFSSTAYSGTCGKHGQWKDNGKAVITHDTAEQKSFINLID